MCSARNPSATAARTARPSQSQITGAFLKVRSPWPVARGPRQARPCLGPRVTDRGLRTAKATDNHGRVLSAEAEAVAQHMLDVLFARHIRYVVQVALRVGRLVVDRRRQ